MWKDFSVVPGSIISWGFLRWCFIWFFSLFRFKLKKKTRQLLWRMSWYSMHDIPLHRGWERKGVASGEKNDFDDFLMKNSSTERALSFVMQWICPILGNISICNSLELTSITHVCRYPLSRRPPFYHILMYNSVRFLLLRLSLFQNSLWVVCVKYVIGWSLRVAFY